MPGGRAPINLYGEFRFYGDDVLRLQAAAIEELDAEQATKTGVRERWPERP